MTSKTLNLARPPIIEAVLDIECDLPPELQFETLEQPATKLLQSDYPKTRKQFLHEFQIEGQVGQRSSASDQYRVQGFQFHTEPGDKIVQIRREANSFNHLGPYASFDEFQPEIERTWNLYLEIAQPVQINSLRLRYINRILLPLKGGTARLEDYLNIAPNVPDDENLTLTGFLNQFSAIENKDGFRADVVLTAQDAEGGNLPVIFDNAVSVNAGVEPGDWPWISRNIELLREFKNRIFKESLTDACLQLFN